MGGWGGSRGRTATYALAAIGLATLLPGGPRDPLAFALSPAGLAIAALAVAVVGDGVEELGSARWIRAGLGLRLAAPGVALLAAAWAAIAGVEPVTRGLGAALVLIGLAGVLAFALRDLRVLRDFRHGQRVSLRKVGEARLDLDANGAAIRLPVASLLGTSLGKTLTRRGLLIAVPHDAPIEGAAHELPWVEERVRERVFFLDEYQLGGDAIEVGERIAAEKAREAGGYR